MNYETLHRIFLFSLICLLSGLLISCEEVDQNALQEEYLREKVSDYRAYQQRSCQKRIVKEAHRKADSFFLDMTKKQSYDSVERPAPFPRPQRPKVDVREDSFPLSPIVNPHNLDSIDAGTDSTELE